jgi:anti-sigma-K factor RskA
MLMNSKKIELKGVEKHPNMLAEVYWDSSKKVYLDIKNLPAAPTGKQYQLWAIVDGKPVDMGMYDSKKSIAIQAMKSVENPQAFAITLEKEGGNPTPTMEEMYVMGTI